MEGQCLRIMFLRSLFNFLTLYVITSRPTILKVTSARERILPTTAKVDQKIHTAKEREEWQRALELAGSVLVPTR